MNKDYFHNLEAGAGIGCVFGMVTGEAIEPPAIGTPAAVGNCAVGAVYGVAETNLAWSILNIKAMGRQLSWGGKRLKQLRMSSSLATSTCHHVLRIK